MAKISFKDFITVDYTQTGDEQLARNAKKRKGFTGGGTNAEGLQLEYRKVGDADSEWRKIE